MQECGSLDMSKYGPNQAGKIKSKYNFVVLKEHSWVLKKAKENNQKTT